MKSNILCGLDESGRGALAGPLVAAAVVLPNVNIVHNFRIPIKDSKKLNSTALNNIFNDIINHHIYFLVEVISSKIINRMGIGPVNIEIFKRLIRKIKADDYIVDGNLKLGVDFPKTVKVKCIPHADATIPATILAGIVAKVSRDKIMSELHQQFPKYHWLSNKGYGTLKHIEAISNYGTSEYHRKIYVTTALNNFYKKHEK
jgi:ribonuclease HII